MCWGKKYPCLFTEEKKQVLFVFPLYLSVLKTAYAMSFPSHIQYSKDPCLSSVWFTLWQVYHIYCCPYGKWDSEEQLIPWNSMNYASFFFALFFFCNQQSRFGGQVGGRQQLAAQPTDCLLLCWLSAASTKHEKCGFPGPRVHGLCTPWPAWGERNGSVSRPGPLERWKDNSPPHCRWTSWSVKSFVSSDTARLDQKDMSGKLQNLLMFLRSWKDLYNTFRFDGLSHVHSGQPFFVDMFK